MGTCLKCPKSGQNKHVPKCPNRKDGSRCEGPLSRVAIRAMLVALRRVAAVGSSVARSLLIPHKVSSLRCGTLRGPRVCVVKMRRRSFTPRFASKTIRSLAHFHSAGDEGMTLVGIWRAFCARSCKSRRVRGPRRMDIRKGERSSRATDKRRSLRRRAGEYELRRSGGGVPKSGSPQTSPKVILWGIVRRGTILPCQKMIPFARG